MPWSDWQFWVVTAVFAVAIWVLWRVLRPGTRKKKAKRVSLTISAPPVESPDQSSKR